MISSAFHLMAYTVLFFLVGMYRPNWPLFFMKQPDRVLIMVITLVMVMISFTMYGEGVKQRDAASKTAPAKTDAAIPTPQPAATAVAVPTPQAPATPVPEPTPVVSPAASK